MLTSHKVVAVATVSAISLLYAGQSEPSTPTPEVSTQRANYSELVSSPGRLFAIEQHRVDERALIVVDRDKEAYGTLEGRILVVRDVPSGPESRFILLDYMGPKLAPSHELCVIDLVDLGTARKAIAYLCEHEEVIASRSEFQTEFTYYTSSGFGFGMKAPARGKPVSLLVHDIERAKNSGQPIPSEEAPERFIVIGGHRIAGLVPKTLSNLLDKIEDTSRAMAK